VTGEEPISPEKATILGPCLVIPQEHPDLDVRSIDVALPPAGSAREAALLDRLRAELGATTHDGPVAYRGSLRWVQSLERIPPSAATGSCPLLREGGVYLITGGMGGIGLILAEHLAVTVRARLVLLGRSAVPARDEWNAWLAAHGDDDLTSRRIRRLRSIEEHGGEVLALAADVADLNQMRSALDQTLTRFGRLDGVIHAAGATTADAFQAVANLGPAEAERQWRPKLHGVRVLEAVLDRCEPDFCLLFSSLSAILGGLGFGAYAAANVFLDAVAHRRTLAGHGRWMSVNWDGWRTSESSAGGEDGGRGGDQGVTAIGPEDGMALFERVLSLGDRPRVVAATGNLRARFNRWDGRAPAPNRTTGAAASPSTPDSALERHARPDIGTAFVAPRDVTEQRVAAIWQDLLGLAQVGVHDSFFDLGGHSLLGLRLTARLRDTFQTECSLQQLFEAPTVAELAALVREQSPDGVADPALAEMLRLVDQLSEQEISALLASSESSREGS
jgi:NAD(P)-dependent dehydrogenase (short-subunit alcohol dehydrogenase family)/acyl carrier protein